MKAKSTPKDPWANEYVYTVNGEDDYEVMSYGPTGQPGGTGDSAPVTSEDAE